jgi:outer membrane receptor protein involved in Fe transport
MSVNYPSFRDIESRTQSAVATVTRQVDRRAGMSHTFKAGLEQEWASNVFATGYPGGAQYDDYNGQPNFLSLSEGTTYRGSQRRTSMFVLDHWRVNERLTIEPGFRIGFYDGSIPGEGVRGYENSSVSPRLGVAWDVARDHRTVVRAH